MALVTIVTSGTHALVRFAFVSASGAVLARRRETVVEVSTLGAVVVVVTGATVGVLQVIAEAAVEAGRRSALVNVRFALNTRVAVETEAREAVDEVVAGRAIEART